MNLDIWADVVPSVFSASFFEARQKFLAASPEARGYPCGSNGPCGERLFTDTAYFGDADAKQLLVLISGVHGPEGYCGSAAQLLFLKAEMQRSLPPSTAVLFVHALNCYGFAWDRRATAEGCDLNRNFVDFSQSLPQNPDYEFLAEHLVPADVSEEGLRIADAAIADFKSVHGHSAYMAVRTGGQYTTPGGLFYGGKEPTEARRTLERIVQDYDLPGRERVLIIDYHTGLGPYGYGELQCEHASGVEGYKRASKLFGPSVTSTAVGNSTSAPLTGTLDDYWNRALGDRKIYLVLEFGTFTNLAILRDEHWLFKHRPDAVNSDIGKRIRSATKNHFYPPASDWKEMVVWRVHQVHRQAVEALRG